MNAFDYRYPAAMFPSTRNVAVTPDDDTHFTPPFRSLYVGTGGNVVIADLHGGVTTWRNVPDGGYVLSGGTRVMAATTASDIIALTD